MRNQGRYADAVREIQAALKLAPGSADLERELVTSVHLSSDYARAERMAREQLAHDPKAADLHFVLGDSLLNQQQVEAAIPALQKAVALDPRLLPAQATLGRALLQSGKADEAIPHLEAALPLDLDGSLHYQLSRAYQIAGHRDKARAALDRYQEIQKSQREEPVAITAPGP